jgi:hypothetical protein
VLKHCLYNVHTLTVIITPVIAVRKMEAINVPESLRTRFLDVLPTKFIG